MKKRRRQPSSAGGQNAPRGRVSRPSPRAKWLLGAVFLAAALGLTTLAILPRRERRTPPALVHEANQMSIEQAAQRGIALGKADQHVEAAPYFRRVADLYPSRWSAHYDYASALQNGAQQVRRHLGRDDPAIRSTYERAVMLRESLARLAEGGRLAQTPRDRAFVAARVAQIYATWGFPLDALTAARAALAIDPASATARDVVAMIENKIKGREAGSP